MSFDCHVQAVLIADIDMDVRDTDGVSEWEALLTRMLADRNMIKKGSQDKMSRFLLRNASIEKE